MLYMISQKCDGARVQERENTRKQDNKRNSRKNTESSQRYTTALQ